MARPKKPITLLITEGKSHLGKAEIEYRKRGEEAMQTDKAFQESAQVKADKVAHAEFIRLKRLYAPIDFVNALDQQGINRYCMEVSNVCRLQDTLGQLSEDLAGADEMEARLKLYDHIYRTNVAMHKSKELLLKFEDRLFLNPAARIRAVPKTPPKEEKPAGMAGFLAKRAEG